MDKISRLRSLSDVRFKRMVGVKRETFNTMVNVYKDSLLIEAENSGVGGRKPKLLPEEQVLLMLEYFREYRTLSHIGFDYGVSESVASRTVRKVETVLSKSRKFSLPAKKELVKGEGLSLDVVIVDVTELPIQRPKKRQRDYYSGKKKYHTIKAQVVIDHNKRIICTDFANGKVHDFNLFKMSRLPLRPETVLEADLGYQGIKKLHPNTEIPSKNYKANPLSESEKELNIVKSSSRIVIEHINGVIKVFQIFSQKYRNRRKRVSLRFNLICGLVNFDKGFYNP